MQMTTTAASGQPAVVVFPAFPARAPVEQVIGLYGGDGRKLIEHSAVRDAPTASPSALPPAQARPTDSSRT